MVKTLSCASLVVIPARVSARRPSRAQGAPVRHQGVSLLLLLRARAPPTSTRQKRTLASMSTPSTINPEITWKTGIAEPVRKYLR
jgi:hypothetical protein